MNLLTNSNIYCIHLNVLKNYRKIGKKMYLLLEVNDLFNRVEVVVELYLNHDGRSSRPRDITRPKKKTIISSDLLDKLHIGT